MRDRALHRCQQLRGPRRHGLGSVQRRLYAVHRVMQPFRVQVAVVLRNNEAGADYEG